jgi:hypothetical protein
VNAFPRQPHEINWAEVAARASATVGVERIAEFSNRLRMRMLSSNDASRPLDPAVLQSEAAARDKKSSVD